MEESVRERGKCFFNFLLPPFLLLLFISSSLACTVTDDAGNRLALAHPAQRIITLSPDLAELVFALGAGSSLVGVIAGSDYPREAKQIPRVGDYRALDLERVSALHPDLILAWSESQVRQVEVLRQWSLPIYISHTRHLSDLPQTLRRLGCLLGKEKNGEQLARRFERRYVLLKQNYHRKTPVTVFYELASQPLITINRLSWINDAIEVCGGKNIFAETGLSRPFRQTAFAVSAEAVVKANPQWVVAGLPPGWERQWQRWPSVTAVKENKLVTINPDLLERPGPRILDGVEELCKLMSRAARPML